MDAGPGHAFPYGPRQERRIGVAQHQPIQVHQLRLVVIRRRRKPTRQPNIYHWQQVPWQQGAGLAKQHNMVFHKTKIG
ncbi:hypothetical protein GCM10028821_52330 [Hymenobacter jeollabukensis]